VPEDSVAVMVAVPPFEKVVWGDPETMLKVTESDEFVVVLPNWSLDMTVVVKPVPAVWGEEMVLMARELTLDSAFSVNVLEFGALMLVVVSPAVST